MKNLDTDILIPFEIHTKERCDSCRKSIHKVFERAEALIHKDGLKFISLNSYSTFLHETLNELRAMAIDSQTTEDYSFYAAHAKLMVKDWTLLVEDILNMTAGPRHDSIKNDLQQAWESVNAELKSLFDHFTSAHEILLQMRAPAPTERILRDYAAGHQTDDCE